MDMMLILIIFCIVFFFVVLLVALGSLFIDGTESTVKSRVQRLSSVPEELKGELNPVVLEEAKKGLLSSVDLKPVLGKVTGDAYFQNLEQELARADIPLRVSEFLILRGGGVVFAFLVVWMLSRNLLYGALAAVIAGIIHMPILHILKAMRINKFTNQLAEFLVLIVNSLRAGQTFMQGCSVAVKESPNPIAAEFKQVIKEVNLGMPEPDSLENMLTRIPSEDLKIVVSGYVIQRKVGGNLAEILETTAHTIRERIKIQGTISTLTTQGKLSGGIVASLPFFIGFAISAINPAYMAPLTGTIPGYCLIGLAVGMQLTGAFIIWRIVDIEI